MTEGVRVGDFKEEPEELEEMAADSEHYGLLWATGFVPAENGGAPEIFKTSWGLDRQ